MTEWHLDPVFDSFTLVLATVGVLSLLVWLGTRRLAVAGRRRQVLVGVRGLLILVIALLMVRPTRVWTDQEALRGRLVVLLDNSRSMTIPDVSGSMTRWRGQQEALRQALPSLEKLAEKMDVELYYFDEELESVDWQQSRSWLARQPDGHQTDIGTALDQVLRRSTSQPLVGIILSSDGAQRALAPQAEILSAARQAVRRGVPVMAVPWGTPQHPSQSRDVALANLPDQYRVFVKNEMSIRGAVRVDGFANQPIPLELTIIGDDGERQKLGPIEVMTNQAREQLPFEFHYTPDRPGHYRIVVSAEPQPGELVLENNELTSFLTVLEGGLRVLHLESNWLYPEQKFIARALAQSPAMQVDQFWVDWRTREQWPIALESEVQLSEYDIFVIGDVHADAISPAAWEAIAQQVERGAGLMMTGGQFTYGSGGYAETPLADVLPVRTDRLEKLPATPDVPLPEDLHLEGPVVMVPVGEHFITRLAATGGLEQVWRELPPLERAYRLRGIKAAARVLAATPDQQPLLVAGGYGTGRTLAFAGNSTYRWWLHGFDERHQRFWQQAILWLANKEDLQQDQLRIALARRRFAAGSTADVRLELVGTDGQPRPADALELTLTSPDGSTQPVTPRREGLEWAASLGPLQAAGEYRIAARALEGTEAIASASAQFAVHLQDLELSDPAANPAQLERLAQMTESFGGRVVAGEELAEVLAELGARPPSMNLARLSKWQPGDTALDAWIFLLTVVGLLTTEWFLRKHWGLV